MKEVLNGINQPCVFWLDAHYCGEMVGVEIGPKWCPLTEELEAIKNHSVKTHTILVDDMRCMENTHVDKNTGIPVGFPGTQNLLDKIKEINPKYKLTYLNGHIKNDVLCARI